MDGVGQGLRGADDDAEFLRTGDAGIDEVALEHHEMGHQQGHDHDGIFRALRLMDGGGVGQRQLVEFRVLVLDAVAIERDSQRPLLRVNILHRADVAVEHVLVVVVAYLHHAIAPTVLESATRKAVANGIDSLLKGDIQVGGSHHTALHRGQHLDVVGAIAVSLGNAVLDYIYYVTRCLFRVFILVENLARN